MDPIPSHVIVGIKDVKADTMTQYYVEANVYAAMRSFSAAAGDPNSILAKFPDDFALYHIGFLTDTGKGIIFDDPVRLALAGEFCRDPSKVASNE